jgi:hypothetical protein
MATLEQIEMSEPTFAGAPAAAGIVKGSRMPAAIEVLLALGRRPKPPKNKPAGSAAGGDAMGI